jgi:hypothetical protein
MGSLSKE